MEPNATPRGVRMPISHIQQHHISIAHRPFRQVFNGNNAGHAFTGEVAKRETYKDHLEWPLVNRFPRPDVAYEPSIVEIQANCPPFCVLPDYYKFWALTSGIAEKFNFWRLDFSERNQLPEDNIPHGAAAVVRAADGRLRFPVWDGMQLHGDLGERLGLKRKYSWAEFLDLCDAPDAETNLAAGDDYKTWCLGDHCPPDYTFPPDWDVLGQLPPALSLNQATAPVTAQVSFPAAIVPNWNPINVNTVAQQPVTAKTTAQQPVTANTTAQRNISSPGNNSVSQDQATSLKKVKSAPKRVRFQLPPEIKLISDRIDTSTTSSHDSDELVALQNEVLALRTALGHSQDEVKSLRTSLKHADYKVKNMVEFAAHHDGVINRLAAHFRNWVACRDRRERRGIVQSISDTIQASENAVVALNNMFPGLKDLISNHENYQVLLDWLRQRDHINAPAPAQ